MKHLEPRLEVRGEQVQVPLPAVAVPHFGAELAKPLTDEKEHRHWRVVGQKKKGQKALGARGWELAGRKKALF